MRSQSAVLLTPKLTPRSLIGRSMTEPQTVLSPKSTFPLPSSHCAFIGARKHQALLEKGI
jgi:hypothetical protein